MIPYGRQSIDEDDINSVVETLKSDYLTTGPKVKEFEEELAKKLNFKFVVAVSSGTSALHLSSIVLLNQGDKVITTPNSFLATSNSIIYQKAKPIFVDIDENGLIDLELVEKKLQQENIKALYLVSFSGYPLDDEKIKYLKEKYKVKILYDNSHFIGKDNGVCDIATYSFHPVKHITTFEGGAIATNDERVYKKLLILRNHGIYKDSSMYPWEYKMVDLGYNYRLTDVACAMGISQLKKLESFQNRRHEIVKYYHENLPKNVIPLYEYNKNSSYHLFVVRYTFKDFNEKAKFFIQMKDKGIALQYHYIPINLQPFYQKKGYKFSEKEFSKMNKYYLEAFSLPIYPKLTQKEQQYVIESLEEVLYSL
jgi:dTDP-4-amino-4,6-dideoxygalactose transaminase